MPPRSTSFAATNPARGLSLSAYGPYEKETPVYDPSCRLSFCSVNGFVISLRLSKGEAGAPSAIRVSFFHVHPAFIVRSRRYLVCPYVFCV